MNNIGNKIKELRQQNNMTLEELGNKIGVGKSTVRKWETGMIQNMKRDKIAKIATVFDVSPSYLLGWDEEEVADWEEKEKDNEVITDIIVRMRKDGDFLSVVQSLYSLNGEQLKGVKQMLNAFLK